MTPRTACLCALTLALALGSGLGAPPTAADDKPATAVPTLAIRVKDAKGEAVVGGGAYVLVRGPKLNAGVWFDTEEPVTWQDFDVHSKKRGRARPLMGDLAKGCVALELPVGAREAWIEVWDCKSAAGEPLAAAILGPVRVRPGLEHVVTLEPARQVIGRAVLPDGVKTDTKVQAYATPIRPHFAAVFPWWRGYVHAHAEVDAEGRIVLDGLGPYRYVVEFDGVPGAAAPAPQVVDLRKRSPADLGRVSFVSATEGIIEVRGPKGKPMAGARVRVFRTGIDGVPRSALPDSSPFDRLSTGADGRVSVSGLHHGLQYTVRVLPPTSLGPKVQPVTAADWDPRGVLVVKLKR